MGVPVGRWTYGSSLTVEFDDRTLAHLQLVIGAKLRRGESFFFTWHDDPETGDGRSTVWMHPSIPNAYKYFGSRMPGINRHWIDALMLTANSPTGLQLVPEPDTNGPDTNAAG